VRFLDRLVISDRQVVAVPDGRWDTDQKTGMWSFRGMARFACVVQEAPERELTFAFVPDDPTSRLSFTASWDEVPILDRPQRPSPVGSVLRIPARLATPGLHTLRVDRVGSADPPDLHEQLDNRFRELSYSVDSRRYPLRIQEVDRERYIGMLAARSVTGVGPRKMAGCVFEGPRAATATLDLEAAGTMSFLLENNSTAPARFSLAVGDASASRVLAPKEVRPIQLAVAAGENRMRLEVAGVGGGLFLWGAPRIAPVRPSHATPIILVTLDTTRRDVLSPYGGPAEASPRLEAFARRATVYDNAWAASPWTLPSHASIFTGLYPSRHGAGVWEDHLTASHATVATFLNDSGYLTAGFAGGYLSSAVWGVARGFQTYRDPEGFETRGDRLIAAVEKELQRHHPQELFLFVNLFDPHALYRAPAEFEERFGVAARRARVERLPVWSELVAGSDEAFRQLIVGDAELTPDGLEYLRAAYLAEVAFMDHQLGRLFDMLDGYGLFDPALVIVVADHGELLGEGGFLSHCCRLDPELVEAPLIIKWPFQTEGRRAARLVSHVDLFATILAAAGLEVIPRDGLALAPEDSSGSTDRSVVFMEEHESRVHPLFENMTVAPHLYGLQQLAWREVVWEGGGSCAAGAPGSWQEGACVVDWSTRLAELGELAKLPSDRGVASHEEALSEEERRNLEALGYVR
jgi:arylsulfatase A-like enzyme